MNIPRRLQLPILASIASAALPAQQLLWDNPTGYQAQVASVHWTTPANDVEAADDFDVTGLVTRIDVDADGCLQCVPPTVSGVRVRFHQWNAGAVGPELWSAFVPAGPNLAYDSEVPRAISVTLPVPFHATGRHFVSVQLHFADAGYWNVWASNVDAPNLSPAMVRTNGGAWSLPTIVPSQTLYADLSFRLFGQPAAGPAQPVACTTWSRLPASRPDGFLGATLRDLDVLAVDDAWAVGYAERGQYQNTYEQQSLVMHWDGDRWSRVASPSPAAGALLPRCQLTTVAAVGPSDVWAGGTREAVVAGGFGVAQHALAMHWDGQSWTVPANLPLLTSGVASGKVQGIAAIAADDVWFAGTAGTNGLLLHWEGSSFATHNLPLVSSSNHQFLYAVDAANGNDVWVVGGAGVPGNVPGSTVPIVFRKSGGSFVHTPFPSPVPGHWIDVIAVRVFATNDVMVFGVTTPPGGAPGGTSFMARWNGSTWTMLPGVPAGAIAAFAPNDIWAASRTVWHWDGSVWTAVHTLQSGDGAIFDAIDGAPCAMFGVGGETLLGRPAPFAARIDSPLFARASSILADPAFAPASMRPTSLPRLGGTFGLAIDDPIGACGASSAWTLWLATTAPAPGWPQPAIVPFGGAGGGAGALFLDPTAPGIVSGVVVWSPGQPAQHTLTVSTSPALLGVRAWAQGLVLGIGGTAVFTNGIDLQFAL